MPDYKFIIEPRNLKKPKVKHSVSLDYEDVKEERVVLYIDGRCVAFFDEKKGTFYIFQDVFKQLNIPILVNGEPI